MLLAHVAWMAVLGTSAGAVAQHELVIWRTAAELKQALRSDDSEVVAWAAHDVRVFDYFELAAPLQQALEYWGGADDAWSEVVCAQILDALVHLDTKVPADLLVPLLDNEINGVAAFILFVRGGARNQVELLRWFERSSAEFSWHMSPDQLRHTAVGNVLSGLRSPGFAACCLQRLGATHPIVVFPQRKDARSRWTNRIREYPRYRVVEPVSPVGFPKHVRYQLVEWEDGKPIDYYAYPLHKPRRGERAEVLTRGFFDVGFARWMSGTKDDGLGRNMRGSGEGYWLHCMSEPASLPEVEDPIITFRDADSFLAEAARFRAQATNYRRALLDELQAQHALTKQEARKFDVPITLVVHDLRDDKRPPLPELPR